MRKDNSDLPSNFKILEENNELILYMKPSIWSIIIFDVLIGSLVLVMLFFIYYGLFVMNTYTLPLFCAIGIYGVYKATKVELVNPKLIISKNGDLLYLSKFIFINTRIKLSRNDYIFSWETQVEDGGPDSFNFVLNDVNKNKSIPVFNLSSIEQIEKVKHIIHAYISE